MHRFFRWTALALALALAAPLAAWKTPVVAAASEQGVEPAVAAHADGSFLVLWRQQDGQLATRAFGASGTPAGAARTLFAPGAGTSVVAWDVAALASGRSVAVWDDSTPLFSSVARATRIQLLDASGQPLGAPETVAQNAHAPARVTALLGGGFVLVWGLSTQFTAQRFDADGNSQTPMLTLASSGSPGDRFAVAVRPDGGFVVAAVRPPSLDRQNVVFRLLGPGGLPVGSGETSVHEAESSTRRSDISVWSGPSGHFVIAWVASEVFPPTSRRLQARLFGPDGQPDSPEIVLAPGWTEQFPNTLHDIVVRPDGSFLVLWSPYPSLRARAYDPTGNPVGADLQVDTAPFQGVLSAHATQTPGGWVATWAAFPQGEQGAQGPFFRLLSGACANTGGASLCLSGNRFRAEVSWRVPATGASGTGTAVARTDDTGTFWFFNPANVELIVKVLDGRGVNGHFWVFYGSLTDVEFDLTVTDTLTGEQRTYHNPAGTLASQADTTAF